MKGAVAEKQLCLQTLLKTAQTLKHYKTDLDAANLPDEKQKLLLLLKKAAG